MPIEKLEEFARDGQKNTDELILTDGFPRPKFPARQWFNYLFNMLSLKINELIDLDPISRSEIIDDLKTNDSKKALSAAQGKILQEKKLEATDLKEASTSQKGIVQLVNDLTTGGTDKALTAEQSKLFFGMFMGGGNYIKIANAEKPSNPWLIQMGGWSILTSAGGTSKKTYQLPVAFPDTMQVAFVSSAQARQSCCLADAPTLTTISISNENQQGFSVTASGYWIAIGN